MGQLPVQPALAQFLDLRVDNPAHVTMSKSIHGGRTSRSRPELVLAKLHAGVELADAVHVVLVGDLAQCGSCQVKSSQEQRVGEGDRAGADLAEGAGRTCQEEERSAMRHWRVSSDPQHSRILSDVVHERNPDLRQVLRRRFLHQLSERKREGESAPSAQTTRVSSHSVERGLAAQPRLLQSRLCPSRRRSAR